MNFEIIMSYVTMGLIIACIYYTFKIVGCVVDYVVGVFKTAMKPEPNRKRRFKNVDEIFTLTEAANEFGFVLYDKINPMEVTDLKNRFRNKAKKAHPDCGGNVEDFVRIKKAYDALLPHAIY